MSVTYQDSNARMSQVAIHNGTVYLAGQVPSDATADMRRPARASARAH